MPSTPRERIVAAAALLVVAAGVTVIVLRLGDDGEAAPAPTTLPAELGAAALRAEVEIEGVEIGDLGRMIEALCTSRDAEALAGEVVATGVTDTAQVRALVEGVGRGALSYCPEVPAEAPQLLNEAYNAAVALLQEGAGG